MENTITGSERFTTEQQFQAACIKLHSEEYPAERQMLHCNMNNSFNAKEGNKAKAMGVKAGVSDLELIGNSGHVHFIELKLPGKDLDPEQIKFRDRVTQRGHFYWVVFTLLEFYDLLKSIYGK